MRLVHEDIEEVRLHNWLLGGYRYLGDVVVVDNCLLEPRLFRPLVDGGIMRYANKRLIGRGVYDEGVLD